MKAEEIQRLHAGKITIIKFNMEIFIKLSAAFFNCGEPTDPDLLPEPPSKRD